MSMIKRSVFDSRSFLKNLWEGGDEDMEGRAVPYKTGDEAEEELGGWTNQYEDVYETQLGEETLLERLEDQFEDAFDDDNGVLAGLGTKFKRVKLDLFHSPRLSHPVLECKPRPVGGVGFLNIVRNPKFPQNDFFHPGRVFCVRVRHNNLAFTADTALDWKVAGIKLADQDQGGPLDLIFHTGRTPPYYNAGTFDNFVAAFKGGEEVLKEWSLTRPVHLQGLIEGSRRCPKSYQDQRYYSHVTYDLLSKDNKRYLARLRLIPVEDNPETGLPRKIDQATIWRREPHQEERREPDYLRRQYTRELTRGPIQYKLQIQTVLFEAERPSMCNACLPWNLKRHPWEELGLLTVSLTLPEELLSKTRMDVLTNQHSCFKPVQPRSTKAFASLTLVLREFHGLASTPSTPEKHKASDCAYNSVQYVIEVKTGSSINAGTDGDVYITLTGQKGRSLPIYLDNKFYDDFEPGSADCFEISARDVGELINVQMELRSILPNRQWHLEYVRVTRVSTGAQRMYPCYRWLSASQPLVVLRDGAGVLPQEERESFALQQRKYDLEERRQNYQWQLVDNLPSTIKTTIYQHLPKDAKLQVEKELDLMEGYLRTLASTGASSVASFLETGWDIFEDCPKMLSKLVKNRDIVKKIAESWKSDEEFGRQFLSGPHPVIIKRVTTLPQEFCGDWKVPEELLDRGRSFSKEIELGHIYILEYPELQNLNPQTDNKGKITGYLTSPKCLLYVRNDGKLIPIAISLQSANQVKLLQNQPRANLIWTPRDKEHDWLVAKMWVKMADAQYHHVISYHFHCLMVLEVFAVATFRNLATVHPVYKLLHPHLHKVIAVNVLGRQHLYPGNDGMFAKFLGVGKQYKELLKQAYKNFTLDKLHLPTDLTNRGVSDSKCLPGYRYRDDSLKLWEVVKKYVRTVIYLHYWSSKTLETDDELQAWISDLRCHGFVSKHGSSHGVPDHLNTLDQLIELITIVIFTASCRSAALTAGVMDYYGYYPNYPTLLLRPPPCSRGEVTLKTLKDTLPNRSKTAEILAACHTLSQPGRDQCILGDFPEYMFSGEPLKATVTAFKEDLERITLQIEERNNVLEIPYPYLAPDAVPNSVSM